MSNITKDTIKHRLIENIKKILKEYEEPSYEDYVSDKKHRDLLRRRKLAARKARNLELGIGLKGTGKTPAQHAKRSIDPHTWGSKSRDIETGNLRKLIGDPGGSPGDVRRHMKSLPAKNKLRLPSEETGNQPQVNPAVVRRAERAIKRYNKKRGRVENQLKYYDQALKAGDHTAQHSIKILKGRLEELDKIIAQWEMKLAGVGAETSMEESLKLTNEVSIVNSWRRKQPWYIPGHDKIRGYWEAEDIDDAIDTSYDHDRAYRERSFGVKEVENRAKRLAAEASEEDQISYNWKNFIDEAKEDLMRGDDI